MGGCGSGRTAGKPTEKDFLRLSISRLRQQRGLREGAVREGIFWYSKRGVSLRVPYKTDLTDVDGATFYLLSADGDPWNEHEIGLSYTTPNYGGKRWWFECPSLNCGKRVAVLYYRQWPECRECWNMAYSSQNKTQSDRCLTQAFKLAGQIELSGNLIEGFKGSKPRGMHWVTYFDKVSKVKRLAHTSLLADYLSMK